MAFGSSGFQLRVIQESLDAEIRAVFRGIFPVLSLGTWCPESVRVGFALLWTEKGRGRALEASFQQYLAHFTLLKQPRAGFGFWQGNFLTAEGPWPHE